jgi:subtilisin family serine protease
MKLRFQFFYFLVFLSAGFVTIANPQQKSSNRPVISSYSNLPKHTYAVNCTLEELFSAGRTGDDFVRALQSDILKDLADYSIQDRTTLKNLMNGVIDAAMILHQDSVARDYLAKVAGLQEKKSAQALSGILPRCAIMATRIGPGGAYVYNDSVFANSLRSAIAGADWGLIQNDIKQMKGRLELASEDFFLGLVNSNFGPFIERSHELSGESAMGLIQMKAFVSRILPFKNTIISTLGEIISENTVEIQDIWADRQIDLSASEDLNPVIIGIWDTGVDPDAYPNQMYINEAEQLNGKDDDDDGFVDDVYGIAYTYFGDPDTHVLLPLADSEKAYVLGFADDLKGGMDLRAGIESEESLHFKQKISSLKPEGVGSFMEGFSHYVNYIHGTHVAGIAISGNPAARIVVSRLSLPYKSPPDLLTIDNARKYSDLYRESVEYFKSRAVRVVCMSWDMSEDFLSKILEVHGVGANQQEREQMGGEMFDIMLSGMKKAMESAPEMLFVVAAGNFDNDIDFQKMLPASISLPNILTVGAVDIAGDETSFTSFGKGVDVYADGYMIESRIPGNKTVALSGTSQAAPEVADLAGKLLAVDPDLTTEEVVDLILRGSSPKKGGRALLINPKRSFALLEERRERK